MKASLVQRKEREMTEQELLAVEDRQQSPTGKFVRLGIYMFVALAIVAVFAI